MLKCKQASVLMSQRLDGKLSPWQALQLRLHLLLCDGCRNFNKQIAFLRQGCQRLFDAADQ